MASFRKAKRSRDRRRLLVEINDVRLARDADTDPIALMERDAPKLNAYFQGLRASGIVDLNEHMAKNPCEIHLSKLIWYFWIRTSAAAMAV